ncbi:hypothetical protein [Tunturiibacter gelidoferens]|jgi:hypothetical protein|uniref:Uncharacterized protein n=1 Tax=Tunturiibacter gelidiferens TaxID=3069689 RepID=A0A9X0QHZ7_9BACT|nr:hypothetical protein [Edaphobacter lichenicola]MBB5330680.1 hypothetical protein [Edaphobacter lichenicola]
MKTKTLLVAASSLELLTGAALFAVPSLVVSFLFSATFNSGGDAVARVGGFALFSPGAACWPIGKGDFTQRSRTIFVFNLLTACFLGYLKLKGDFTSILLLPACILHGVLALLLARPAYTPS